jgi:hypothetical protein
MKAIITFICLFTTYCHADSLKIVTAKNFKEVHAIIDAAHLDPESTLIAVDIDLTLTMANHPALDLPNYQQHKHIFDQATQGLTPLQIEKMFTHGIMLAGQHTLDESSYRTIEALKQKKFKVIGFTASIVGPLGSVRAIEDMRYRILDVLGFKFSETFGPATFSLEDIIEYNGHVPRFHKGILFANGGRAPHNKGDVIRAFLKQVHYKPKTFIIIDDRLKNIQEIGLALKEHDPEMKVLGIEFTYAHGLSTKLLTAQAFSNFWHAIKQQLIASGEL